MASLLNPVFRRLYAAARPGGVIDVTRLLHLPAAALRPVAAPSAYQLGALQAPELEDLLAQRLAPTEIGRPEALGDGRHRLIVARQADHVVAYVWLTRERVDAGENYSRAAHLGTPLQLAADAAFVHTALTLPEHRGRHLLPALLTWAVAAKLSGAARLLTTVDWTNRPSQAAFERVGFEQVGLIWRLGRGELQLTGWPRSAAAAGVTLGTPLPGLRL